MQACYLLNTGTLGLGNLNGRMWPRSKMPAHWHNNNRIYTIIAQLIGADRTVLQNYAI